MKFVVAFSSPKRSAKLVDTAARHAKALGAEIVLLRVVPDPEKVGVIAQLISTDRPQEKAQQQIDEVVTRLKRDGLNVSGMVKVGEVAKTISETAQQLGADLLFVGTNIPTKNPPIFFKKDPIVHYLIEHCLASMVLIRSPDVSALDDTADLSGEDEAVNRGVETTPLGMERPGQSPSTESEI